MLFELRDVVFVNVHAMRSKHIVAIESVPVERIVYRRNARREPHGAIGKRIAARFDAAHRQGRRATHDVAIFLIAASHVHRDRKVELFGDLVHFAENSGVACVQGLRCNADLHAVGIGFRTPTLDIGNSFFNRGIDLRFRSRANAAIELSAQTDVLGRLKRRARAREVGNRGYAAGNHLHAADDRGIVAIVARHHVGLGVLGHKPFGIGHIVHDTAQCGVLEMGMAIDETRHDRASTEVTHFLLWIVRLHALRAADLHDSGRAGPPPYGRRGWAATPEWACSPPALPSAPTPLAFPPWSWKQSSTPLTAAQCSANGNKRAAFFATPMRKRTYEQRSPACRRTGG